jgi:hypothetical protein
MRSEIPLPESKEFLDVVAYDISCEIYNHMLDEGTKGYTEDALMQDQVQDFAFSRALRLQVEILGLRSVSNE